MKTPKRKKPKSHLPALSQLTRDMLAMQMGNDARIPATVSAAIMDSFNAASNPGAESPAVVIETLDKEERDNVRANMPAYQQIFGGVGARGRNALLMDLSIDELANSEGEE